MTKWSNKLRNIWAAVTWALREGVGKESGGGDGYSLKPGIFWLQDQALHHYTTQTPILKLKPIFLVEFTTLEFHFFLKTCQVDLSNLGQWVLNASTFKLCFLISQFYKYLIQNNCRPAAFHSKLKLTQAIKILFGGWFFALITIGVHASELS